MAQYIYIIRLENGDAHNTNIYWDDLTDEIAAQEGLPDFPLNGYESMTRQGYLEMTGEAAADPELLSKLTDQHTFYQDHDQVVTRLNKIASFLDTAIQDHKAAKTANYDDEDLDDEAPSDIFELAGSEDDIYKLRASIEKSIEIMVAAQKDKLGFYIEVMEE